VNRPHFFRLFDSTELTLDKAGETIDWYKKAFGAEGISRSVGPDGTIMHAELRIGNSRFMMNDVMMGGKGPKAFGGSPASFWLYVDACDGLFTRAVNAGAEVRMPMADQLWGDRGGAVGDPEGFTWWIATRTEDLTQNGDPAESGGLLQTDGRTREPLSAGESQSRSRHRGNVND
jgi:PhnB protein